MDTKGLIKEHSKIKLELYRLYLERYLAVLLVVPNFDSIWVHDVFAGSGISKNDEKGSAVIAAEVISNISSSQNPKNKKIHLSLNEADNANFVSLQENMKCFRFASVKRGSAEEYIQSWSPTSNSHNLFFLDPYGYSQISFQHLKDFFAARNRDFLVFIPIYHIYRFLRKDGFEELKPLEEQLVPIASFLYDLGIGSSEAVGSLDDFCNLIVAALKKISGTAFVYKQIIDNKERNSRYGLFFISHNILGADKFLEAQEKLKEAIEQEKAQMSFDFIEDQKAPSIFDAMEMNEQYDNTELYKLGIIIGIRSSEVMRQLKELETPGGKIRVDQMPRQKRNRGAFYVS